MTHSPDAASHRPSQASGARHVLLVSQPYIATDQVLNRLTPSPPSEGLKVAGAGGSDLPGSVEVAANLRITDLSGLSLARFNRALLSLDADAVLIVVDAAFGLSGRDTWAKALACLADIPQLIFAIDNLGMVEDGKARFAALRDELSDHAADFACRRIDLVPVDASSGADIADAVAGAQEKPAWYQGPTLQELVAAPTRREPSGAATDVSDQFSVYLCWFGKAPMLPGRRYLFDNGAKRCEAHVSMLKHRYNPENMEHQAAKSLVAGNIGYANLALDDEISFKPFVEDHRAGRFSLFDPESGAEVAFGIINFGLRRATNIKWHQLAIDKQVRAGAKQQKPCLLWFTGLSGSGKSTVASLLEKKLHALGKHTYVLDGDNVRHGLCRDLGFTDADRVENLRRIGETGKLFVDAGLIVLVAFISPFRAERHAAREMLDDGEFIEIFVDTSIAECERRDPKGLYKKARAGQLKNFTGIDSPYEPPLAPEIVLDGGGATPEMLAEQIIAYMQERQLIATS